MLLLFNGVTGSALFVCRQRLDRGGGAAKAAVGPAAAGLLRSLAPPPPRRSGTVVVVAASGAPFRRWRRPAFNAEAFGSREISVWEGEIDEVGGNDAMILRGSNEGGRSPVAVPVSVVKMSKEIANRRRTNNGHSKRHYRRQSGS
jgi:hypothetical protein